MTALGEHARTYVAETPDREYAGGLTVLYSNEEGYYIQGGTHAGHAAVNPNALLHWRVIEDVHTDPALSSVTRYDLGNATIESLSRYKSKYGDELLFPVSPHLGSADDPRTAGLRVVRLLMVPGHPWRKSHVMATTRGVQRTD